jgi:hypothetical protein
MSKDEFERTMPHTRGYWSGHVFVPVVKPLITTKDDNTKVYNDDDDDDDDEKICPNITTNAAPTVDNVSMQQVRLALEHSGWSGTLIEHSEWHISLSRPFLMPFASIESFLQDINAIVSYEQSFVLRVPTQDICVLTNDEGTRTFLAWTCSSSTTANLTRLVRQIDLIMQKYKLKPFYQPPRFHVSFASFRGKAPHGLDTNLRLKYVQERDDEPNEILFSCRNISCTFGTTKRKDFLLLN